MQPDQCTQILDIQQVAYLELSKSRRITSCVCVLVQNTLAVGSPLLTFIIPNDVIAGACGRLRKPVIYGFLHYVRGQTLEGQTAKIPWYACRQRCSVLTFIG